MDRQGRDLGEPWHDGPVQTCRSCKATLLVLFWVSACAERADIRSDDSGGEDAGAVHDGGHFDNEDAEEATSLVVPLRWVLAGMSPPASEHIFR